MINNNEASPEETIGYIESMLTDLRQLGKSIDAGFLVYLIEMAMVEASDIRAGNRSRAAQRKRAITSTRKLSPEAISKLYLSGALD